MQRLGRTRRTIAPRPIRHIQRGRLDTCEPDRVQLGWRVTEAGLRERLDRASALAPTYAEVGATRNATLPEGYHHVQRRERLGTGAQQFDTATKALMTYAMHRRSGLRVCSSDAQAVVGGTVLLGVVAGPLAITFPCRIVSTQAEPRRVGFAYGTLTGHPESGEEAFTVELSDDDSVHLVIRAFSKPGSPAMRAAGPLARYAQARFTDRYIHALRRLTTA